MAAERWEKLGLIFRPNGAKPWMRSHAALPVPLQIDGSRYRVFFASRDARNRSHVGWFEIDLDRPTEVLAVADEPVLAPGPLGFFDDHGVYAASAVWTEGRVFLYTIGWNPGARPPLFYASIGLAVSEDGGLSFRKYGLSPIMTRSDHDPCLVTSPFVLRENKCWRMWYVSGTGWTETEGQPPKSEYHIKYAESDDGIVWRRDGRVCIDRTDPAETNIARACVLKDKGVWRAWFSSNRGEGYRIGAAESPDGLNWVRCEAGIELSAAGWDSEAMAYPYVLRHGNRLFMFYNGNGFGREGIGLAIAED